MRVNENRTWNLVQWVQGTCSLYWTGVQSPLWVQLLFLIADYKTFFDLSVLRHYTDIVQISLLLPQAIPFWDSLRSNQQVWRQCSYLTLTQCCKVYAFMIPVTLPSGSVTGYYSKKTMKKNHQHSFLKYAVLPSAISMKFLKAVKVPC